MRGAPTKETPGLPLGLQGRVSAMSIPEPNTGCWLWLKKIEHKGYGQMWAFGKMRQAHRVAYEAFVGPIPAGLTIDHKCRVRCCVNPIHLEPVTMRENTLRGETGPAFNAAKTHCIRGHPFSGKNLRIDRRGWRVCRRCPSRVDGRRARND